MEALLNDPNFNLEKFADSLAKDGREGVKWERRKLAWIEEEDAKGRETSEAA